ncbi:MAG: M23 family metallopeptidase, partial [Acidimicrobiales bacterium]
AAADAAAQLAEAAALAAEADLEVLRGNARDAAARIRPAGTGLDQLKASPAATFPVAAGWDFIDSWGFPRSDDRWHQGADIFADYGAPLVAVEDGLAQVGRNDLGGLVVHLTGRSGNRYYYAHLSRSHPLLDGGAEVEVRAGDVIGFNGDSGNARGGAAHLHFEVHPRGGGPVNPYPLLRSLSEAVSSARRRGAEPTLAPEVLAKLSPEALVDVVRSGGDRLSAQAAALLGPDALAALDAAGILRPVAPPPAPGPPAPAN